MDLYPRRHLDRLGLSGVLLLRGQLPFTVKCLTEKEGACVHARREVRNDTTRDEAFTWKNLSFAMRGP